MAFDPNKQTLDNVTQTLINVTGDTNLGTSLPPRQFGEFRVPFVKNLRIGPVHNYLGGTQYTLLWDQPDDTTNVSHYNVFAKGALQDNQSPLGPWSAQVSPASFRIVTTTAAILTFFVQTQLSNGNCSDLDRSPSVTALSVDPTLTGADITGGLPAPGPTVRGGVMSFAPTTSQWINSITTSGTPVASQPAFSDISGAATTIQGGTGHSVYTNGQLLIGNSGTGALTQATLSAGFNTYITNSPGAISVASMTAYTAVAANYAALPTDYTIEITGGGVISVTLPTAIGILGKVYHVVNTGVSTCILATTAGETIMGAGARSIPTLTSVSVKSNGANWLFAS